ncbi:MAG: D-alanine--D-alanine ligase [Acidobacteriia bacterium]|nr:D-alanine--D-alanine ligase [Terriglobia bacterium]
MRVALLFNARPMQTPDSLPEDWYEEYDKPETIAAVAFALEGIGARVTPLPFDRCLPRKLDEGSYDFVFNIAEGHGRRCREAVPAAICELLGIPYTGSDPLTLALTLDKWLARRAVSPEVPVARAAKIESDADVPALETILYPAIVKPNDEGSSKGIRSDSVVSDAGEAADLCRRLRESYGCPVLVEEFLPGTEVTVGMAGNGKSTRLLGMMEVAPADENEQFVYSVEVKRDWRNRVRYYVPPRIDQGARKEVERLAMTAYVLLGCRDIARIDFRFDGNGRPRFLECNPLPGLDPDNSDIVLLSKRDIAYDHLVQGILLAAAGRNGVSLS